MKSLILTSLILISSVSAFADEISVTINGRNYICSGGRAEAPEPAPYLVRDYCECDNTVGVYLKRVGIMSDGTAKVISSKSLSPANGSYNPTELMRQCQQMARECR